MKQNLYLLIVLLLSIPTTLQALPDFYTFDMRDGLPETRIRALAQMSDGRMAIATAGTITIYDGTRFTVYHLQPENRFPLNDYHGFRQLNCDSTGQVWLRNDRSLYVLDRQELLTAIQVESLLNARNLSAKQVAAWPVDEKWKTTEAYQEVSEMVDEEISCIVHDSYGGLWVGLKESGLLYSNPSRKRQFSSTSEAFTYDALYPFCSPRASQLSAKYAPSATNCTLEGRTLEYAFLGTRKGIIIINREDKLIATIDEHDGLSTNNVVALINDHRGDVWAVTASGLTRIHQTGRDSFDIVNYSLLDGIDTQGREFRTCQIHRNDSNLITVGFVGGTLSFHPDSVTAPRYTFHFPKAYKPEDGSAASVNYWLIAIACMICATAIAYTLLRFKRKNRQAANSQSCSDTPNQTQTEIGETMAQDIAQQTVQQHLTSSELEFLDRLKTTIEQYISEESFSVQTLSDMMAMDRTVLYRRMQTLTGIPPSVYIKNIRMDIARRLLLDTDLPIGDVARKTGFATTKYFSAAFKDSFGMTPNEFRNNSSAPDSHVQ